MKKISLNHIEKELERISANLPSLPITTKEMLVTYGPYIILIFAILLCVSFITKIITGYFLFSSGTSLLSSIQMLYYVLDIITATILFSVFGSLKQKRILGWRSLFYLSLLYIFISLITEPLQVLVSFFFFAIILYILFQIKSYYS